MQYNGSTRYYPRICMEELTDLAVIRTYHLPSTDQLLYHDSFLLEKIVS
jgi:hypothetical protein